MSVNSIHVVPHIDREASGLSYTVPRLCRALSEHDHPARLAVLDPLPPGTTVPFVRAFAYGMGPRRLGRSPQMQAWLRQQAQSGLVDLIHAHSLWRMPNVYPAGAVRGTACKLVVSPRGTLSAQALGWSAVTKKIFWGALQGPAVVAATALHATSLQEYHDIRNMGLTQPVAVVANGVDVPPAGGRKRAKPLKQLLFLGRIHPIKGLKHLLAAWKSLQDKHLDWELVVAGPDVDGHLGELMHTASALNLQRCRFAGPVYGSDKLAVYREADLYVLPTLSENFGMTIAEALAAGTPVMTTRNAPWQGLEVHKAGWWIDGGTESLIAALGSAMETPADRLAEMGQSGRNWMVREHSWNAIAQDMASFYEWAVGGGDAPGFVQFT